MTQPWPLAITRTLIPCFANPRVPRTLSVRHAPARLRFDSPAVERCRAAAFGPEKSPGFPAAVPRRVRGLSLFTLSCARVPLEVRRIENCRALQRNHLSLSLSPLAKRRRKERTNRFYPTHLIGAEERIPDSRDGVSSRVSFLRNNAPVTPKPVIAPNSYRPHGCRRVGVTLFLRSASPIWRSRARSRETSHGSS